MAKINDTLERILNISAQELNVRIHKYKEIQQCCIKEILERLNLKRNEIVTHINSECNQMDEKVVREELASYKIKKETEELDNFIDRIKKFRL